VPVVLVRRPPWTARPGDNWVPVATLQDAAAALPALGQRVFLTVGRQGVADFAGVESTWFLIRAIDPPTGAVPPEHELLLARGPFTVDHETELFESRRIEVLVTKNSGGEQTSAKLDAARNLGRPVVIVDRPPLPAGVAVVETAAAAVDWLRRL
jgi:precorrin-6A/cobalt-precorrin-6A reductase